MRIRYSKEFANLNGVLNRIIEIFLWKNFNRLILWIWYIQVAPVMFFNFSMVNCFNSLGERLILASLSKICFISEMIIESMPKSYKFVLAGIFLKSFTRNNRKTRLKTFDSSSAIFLCGMTTLQTIALFANKRSSSTWRQRSTRCCLNPDNSMLQSAFVNLAAIPTSEIGPQWIDMPGKFCFTRFSMIRSMIALVVA